MPNLVENAVDPQIDENQCVNNMTATDCGCGLREEPFIDRKFFLPPFLVLTRGSSVNKYENFHRQAYIFDDR